MRTSLCATLKEPDYRTRRRETHKTHAFDDRALVYSPVSNIGDIWSLKEGADESAIVLDMDKVGLDAFLQQFV
jgi:hypothetical protein